MGNTTSSAGKAASLKQSRKHSTAGKMKAGALDAATQLEAMYTQAIISKEVKDEMQDLFKDVRILVVGRSGSGKSTLIRLMVGEKGPQSICRGKAGEQDIGVEWRYPDPDLPLIFHDSNGIDVMGANRLKVIRKFLDKHQKSKDFKQRIHLVWYVFSAADTRFLDDGGLLELLMEYEIPLLLIMTFNDQPSLVKQNVEGEPLNELLGRIKEPSRREKALEDMIRLGNSVKVQKDGCLVGRGDVSGLRELTQKTKNMIDKKLHKTWIACQVMDTEEKLEMSARLIVRKKRAEAFMTCVVGAMPLVQQAQLGYMFLAITRSLVKIWRVPEQMEKALMAEFFVQEGGNKMLQNFFKTVVAGVGLAGSVAATVVTAGAASVVILGVMAASAFTQMQGSSTLLMTYALLNLGAILYTKSIQCPNDDWDRSTSQEEFSKYAYDFTNSNYAQDMRNFIVEYKSSWEGATKVKHQTRRLKSQLIAFLQELMRQRPTSLHSLLKQEVEVVPKIKYKWDEDHGDEDIYEKSKFKFSVEEEGPVLYDLKTQDQNVMKDYESMLNPQDDEEGDLYDNEDYESIFNRCHR